MTTQFNNLAAHDPGVGGDRELLAAARMLLQRMGVDPADLMLSPDERPRVPTFDVITAVSIPQ